MTPSQRQAVVLTEKAYHGVRRILAEDFSTELVRLEQINPGLVIAVWTTALTKAFFNFVHNVRLGIAPNVGMERFAEGMLRDFDFAVRHYIRRGGGLEWHGPGFPPKFRFTPIAPDQVSEAVKRVGPDLGQRMSERITKLLGEDMREEIVSLEDPELLVKVWMGALGASLAQVIFITDKGAPDSDIARTADIILADFSGKVRVASRATL